MTPATLSILVTLAGLHELEGGNKELPTIRRTVASMPRQELVDAVMTLTERFTMAMAATQEHVKLLGLTEFGMQPHQVDKLNLPTITGSLMGLALPEVQEGKCCGTCAFRQGSAANQCIPTVGDAFEAAENCEDFFCHEGAGGDGGKPLKLCRGWAQATRLIAEAA